MKVYVVYYYVGMPCIDKVFSTKEKALQRVEEQNEKFCGQITFSFAEREIDE